jgi:phytoene synthase
MSPSHDRLVLSYDFCRRTTRRARSSFAPCFLLLPRPKRRAMNALYAFMRHTDDLVDGPEPAAVRRERLGQWRTRLEAALGHGPTSPVDAADDPGSGTAGAPVLIALADAARRFAIPAEHLVAVLDGVAMDLDGTTYETFDDLAVYCRRVASAVGLACIRIWGFRGEGAFEPARKCGIALQLTNILRDLKEDAAWGRVYLPREDLRRFDYSVDDLTSGVVDERFDRLVSFEVDRARRLYRDGAELFDWLEPDGRRIFGMMITIYHRLLCRVDRARRLLFSERVGLSRCEKLRIAARWALLPPRRPRVG